MKSAGALAAYLHKLVFKKSVPFQDEIRKTVRDRLKEYDDGSVNGTVRTGIVAAALGERGLFESKLFSLHGLKDGHLAIDDLVGQTFEYYLWTHEPFEKLIADLIHSRHFDQLTHILYVVDLQAQVFGERPSIKELSQIAHKRILEELAKKEPDQTTIVQKIMAHAGLGNKDEAMRLIENTGSKKEVALIYATEGQLEKAEEMLALDKNVLFSPHARDLLAFYEQFHVCTPHTASILLILAQEAYLLGDPISVPIMTQGISLHRRFPLGNPRQQEELPDRKQTLKTLELGYVMYSLLTGMESAALSYLHHWMKDYAKDAPQAVGTASG
jgi:hypothetical protein